MESPVSIVLDTSVLEAALLSSRGAAFRLLFQVGRSPDFTIHLSVPLVLEYEDVAKRDSLNHGLSSEEVDAVIDYLCTAGKHHRVHYLWRPFLSDPKDDMVLEVAVAGNCAAIVTFNQRDFARVPDTFGIRVLLPRDFLREIGDDFQ